MTKELMRRDAEEFKRLCTILEPENILCLGRITFECAYEALTGEEMKIKGNYTDFVANYKAITLNYGDSVKSRIYALVHPGQYGTMSRSLEDQGKDWKKIAEDNK